MHTLINKKNDCMMNLEEGSVYILEYNMRNNINYVARHKWEIQCSGRAILTFIYILEIFSWGSGGRKYFILMQCKEVQNHCTKRKISTHNQHHNLDKLSTSGLTQSAFTSVSN